eukprot:jgi/Psemu1/33619/gm1.33619_g
MISNTIFLAAVATVCLLSATSNAFSTSPLLSQASVASRQQQRSATHSSLYAKGEATLKRVAEDDDGVPIPFLDRAENSFIECYADSVITVDGVEYTIGVPCDYCVALCYFEGENLVPVELNDELMDDIFPIAENIVEEEFEEELTLQRTPQTLTLVGELEEEDRDEEDEDDFDDDDDDDSDEEQVEVLLTFEHRDKEINLVRLLDPVLLVGKPDKERADLRVLLSPDESEKIMPILERTFLTFHDDVLP